MKKFLDIVIMLAIIAIASVLINYYKYDLAALFKMYTKQKVVKSVQEKTKAQLATEKTYPKYVNPTVISPKNLQGFKKFKYKYTFTFNFSDEVTNFNFKASLPATENEVQYISEEKFPTIKPEGIYNIDGNRYAIFKIAKINQPSITMVVEGTALTRTNDIYTVKRTPRNIFQEPNIQRYLKSEKFIESDDSYVRAVASQISGTTEEEIIENVFNYLHDNNFKYVIYEDRGARQTLISRQGKCTDYAALMTALLRAKGIPARVVTGIMTSQSISSSGHAWVEAYMRNYGWVILEPTSASLLSDFDSSGNFLGNFRYSRYDKIPTNYITSGRNIFTNASSIFEHTSDSTPAEFIQKIEVSPL